MGRISVSCSNKVLFLPTQNLFLPMPWFQDCVVLSDGTVIPDAHLTGPFKVTEDSLWGDPVQFQVILLLVFSAIVHPIFCF